MPVQGVVDSLRQRQMGGWADAGDHDEVKLEVVIDDHILTFPVDIVRQDMVPSSTRRGFVAVLPRTVSASELVSGAVEARFVHGDERAPAKIWEPIRKAAEVETYDAKAIKASLRFVDGDSQTALVDAFANRSTWKVLPDRKKLCVIAYANDAGAWFSYFYQHYCSISGAESIYIATPKPESFSGYGLGGTISLKGMPYDNDARAQLMTGLCRGLQAYYEWTLLCDVDEILIPHPASGLTFMQMLDRLEGPTSISRGFDVIQASEEADFDMSKPILDQRRWGIATSGMCKPHLARKRVNWGTGYHYTDLRPSFEKAGSGFITLHLKWACARIRSEVAAIVDATSYSGDFTANYARSSVIEPLHPALREGSVSREALASSALVSFEAEFLRRIAYDPDRGLWVCPHFHARALFSIGRESE